MKRLLLHALGLCVLASCSEPTTESAQDNESRMDLVRKQAEENILANIGDPESYEFVSIELVDSVRYSDNIRYRRAMFTNRLNDAASSLDRELDNKTSLPVLYSPKDVEQYRTEIDKHTKLLKGIDSLEAALGADTSLIASYTYLLKFRSNNAFGAKSLNSVAAQTSSGPEYSVINIASSKEKLIINPNDFPGYKEVAAKHL